MPNIGQRWLPIEPVATRPPQPSRDDAGLRRTEPGSQSVFAELRPNLPERFLHQKAGDAGAGLSMVVRMNRALET